MIKEIFVILLVTLFVASFTWAFRPLPQEKWQIIAAVLQAKETDGLWRGRDLTCYGYFQGFCRKEWLLNSTVCLPGLPILLIG